VVCCIFGGLELGASDDDSLGVADGDSLFDKLGAADGNDVIGCRHHCWSSGWFSCRT
jgi:hypothetical protein